MLGGPILDRRGAGVLGFAAEGHLSGPNHVAFGVDEGDRVQVHNLLEHGHQNGVARFGIDLLLPAVEDVRVLGGRILGRRLALKPRLLAKGQLDGPDHVAVLIDEDVGVRDGRRGVGSDVGGVAAHSRNLGRPAGEGIRELRRRGLGGRLPRIHGHGAKGPGARLQHGAVVVHEAHGVRVHGRREGGLVGGVAGHGHDLGRPAGEGVRVLRRRSLGRRVACVLRNRAVRDVGVHLEHRAVLVQPGHRVLIGCIIEGRRVGRIARDGLNRLVPADERVRELRRGGLGRGLALVLGQRTEGQGFGLQHGAVLVHEAHGVLVQRLREERPIRCGHTLDGARIPAGEREGILRRRGLHRRRARVRRRRLARNVGRALQLGTVAVEPDQGVDLLDREVALRHAHRVVRIRVEGRAQHAGIDARRFVVVGADVGDRAKVALGD